MNFFIKLIKKIFVRNKIQYISSPKEKEEKYIKKEENKTKDNFKIDLIYQTDPEICDGNGYKIQKFNLKDMI